MSGTGPRSGPAGATAPAINGVRDVNGTGPRSGPAGVTARRAGWRDRAAQRPAGATAPARRKARSQASGASARRLREDKRVYRPATAFAYR